MDVQIIEFLVTKFMDISMPFSYDNYRIFELRSTFIPKRSEIENRVGTDYYNVQISLLDLDFAQLQLFKNVL
jgi:hypothetical protein